MDTNISKEIPTPPTTVYGEISVSLDAVLEAEEVFMSGDIPAVEPGNPLEDLEVSDPTLVLRDNQSVKGSDIELSARYANNGQTEVLLHLSKTNRLEGSVDSETYLALRDGGEVYQLSENAEGERKAKKIEPEETDELLEDIRTCRVASVGSNR